MQNDELIWQLINYQFCSFKSKVAKEHTFCRNPYNVSGLCLRSACPLANSRYATIREEDGVCYLFVKTIERAHTPKDLWEKIKLPANYAKALEMVSENLQYFPKYLIHRNKQRLTKIHQMLIRMRKLKLKAKPKIVTTNTKVDRREIGKERKALKAAQLDVAIENELLERLKQVSEGEIYNYPEQLYSKALKKAAGKYADENKEDEDEDEEEEEDNEEEEDIEDGEEEEEGGEIEFVEDFDPSDEEEEEEEDIEDMRIPTTTTTTTTLKQQQQNSKRKADTISSNSSTSRPKKGKGGTRVDIEYELEDEEEETEERRTIREKSHSMDFNF